jgi:hypothetical protein
MEGTYRENLNTLQVTRPNKHSRLHVYVPLAFYVYLVHPTSSSMKIKTNNVEIRKC